MWRLDWYIYCPNFDQCFDPDEKWLCNGECLENPSSDFHTPCNGTCNWPYYYFCEEEERCYRPGIPCAGVCLEKDEVLCDAQYCNHYRDIDDFKFDCYDRSDETDIKEEFEISLDKNNLFLQLTETLDPDIGWDEYDYLFCID